MCGKIRYKIWWFFYHTQGFLCKECPDSLKAFENQFSCDEKLACFKCVSFLKALTRSAYLLGYDKEIVHDIIRGSDFWQVQFRSSCTHDPSPSPSSSGRWWRGGTPSPTTRLPFLHQLENFFPQQTVLFQVWSLTQFYSVDFSQARIGVKKCVFNKRAFKVCVSYIWWWHGILARHTWWCWFSVVR